MPFRAARRARRAGSTGPVQRVADPFRQGFWKFLDGTATGRLFKTTAVEITAVDGGRRATDFCTANRRISHISNIFRAFLVECSSSLKKRIEKHLARLKKFYLSHNQVQDCSPISLKVFQRELPAKLQLTKSGEEVPASAAGAEVVHGTAASMTDAMDGPRTPRTASGASEIAAFASSQPHLDRDVTQKVNSSSSSAGTPTGRSSLAQPDPDRAQAQYQAADPLNQVKPIPKGRRIAQNLQEGVVVKTEVKEEDKGMCATTAVANNSRHSRDAKPVSSSNETSAKNPTAKRIREENVTIQEKARGSPHRKDRTPQSTKSESRGRRHMKRDVSEDSTEHRQKRHRSSTAPADNTQLVPVAKPPGQTSNQVACPDGTTYCAWTGSDITLTPAERAWLMEVCLRPEFVNTAPGRKPVNWTALAYEMYLESMRRQSPETFRPLFKEVLGRIWDVKEWRPPGQYDMFPVFDKSLLWTDWIKTPNGVAYREGRP
ncbi:hypothetical protein B0H10DRAFT_1946018 [Mycena sp. CBHHK59/15]|nr:hypothetical protein B0H10DRAFT_1946018 [Mycena sp. CBHHK59/15]